MQVIKGNSLSIKEKFKEWSDQPDRATRQQHKVMFVKNLALTLLLAGTVELHVFFGMIEQLFACDPFNILYRTYQMSS